MKMADRMMVTALALGVSAWAATAQDESGPPRRGTRPPPGEGGGPGGPGGERGPGGGPGGGGQRFMPPIMTALDANGDGVIDEKEIENATAALKKLDKNGDGKLSREEYMGMRPGGPGGPGGQGGPGMRGQGRGPGGPPPGDGQDQPQRPARQRPSSE